MIEEGKGQILVLVVEEKGVERLHEGLLFEVNSVGKVLEHFGHQNQATMAVLLGKSGPIERKSSQK